MISDDDQPAPTRQQQQQQPQQIGDEERLETTNAFAAEHDADLDDQNGVETIVDALPMTGASTYWSRIRVVPRTSIHQVYIAFSCNRTPLGALEMWFVQVGLSLRTMLTDIDGATMEQSSTKLLAEHVVDQYPMLLLTILSSIREKLRPTM
ncbi:hypothetical protein [Parasitella parasitica]|uniref:Uncharacterized protein n=1 Tax=Parasitella parasitica TaxID=35722 RepID=A0A0B7NCA5_9FUNG|nr:hypothetical protein [Parasitella parasitica]